MKFKFIHGRALLSVMLVAIILAGADEKLKSPDDCSTLVLAHRGASGYIPENTIAAFTLAIEMGADYLEMDLMMTKDKHLIARYSNELGVTTDVADHPEFTSRRRFQKIGGLELNGWFSEDFTLEEIKTLRAKERLARIRPNNTRMDGVYEIPTLQEIIDLVKTMEDKEKRIIGIYPEIKLSDYYQSIGLPVEEQLLDTLHINGYRGPKAPVCIKSYDIDSLISLKNKTDIRLIQLMTTTSIAYDHMSTSDGLREVADYAYAVGPHKSYIYMTDEKNNLGESTSFVRDAQAVGLKVHAYTFRAENIFLPAEYKTSNDSDETARGDLESEIKKYLSTGLDGIFTDNPDIGVRARGRC